jgi:putative nucleotidyltransferase with HDIG domain
MSQLNISAIINRIDDLPTLPRTILRITEVINNPRSSADDLSRIITDDQVLTARLLKLVNSSFYGFPQRISTVAGAIVLLGFDAIRNLLLTSSIFDFFPKRGKNFILEPDELWDHSLGCAVGAKVIGSYIRHEKVEELFVAGLLHDIGKIVQILYLKKDFEAAFSYAREQNSLIFTAENRTLGYNHAQVGKLLAEKWNLPSKLADVIAFHHEPGLAENLTQDIAVVHVADVFCRGIMIGSGGDNRVPKIDKLAWESIQLDLKKIKPIMEQMEEEIHDIKMTLE